MNSTSDSNRRVLHNAFFLSILQLFNFLVPLLLLPYLTRTLSIKEFGVVMIALSSLVFSYVITDYGFSLSATYFISRNREEINSINNLIGRIFSAKILLVAIALILLVALSLLPAYYEYKTIFWSGFPAVIAQAYQPIWFFHGMERMKHYTTYMVLTKLFYLAFVFILVKQEGDGCWVLLGWSMAQLLGLAASMYMMRQLGFHFIFGSIASGIEELKLSSKFFYSRLAVATYTVASSIIIGLTSLHQAAVYSSAEQVYKAGQAVTGPINQALHPHMAREKNWKLFFLVVPVISILLFLGTFFVFVFRDYFVTLVFGEDYLESTHVLSIFLITLLVNYLGVSFGYPACSALSRPDIANRSVLYGVVIFFISVIIFYFSSGISAIKMALSVLFAEFFVAFYRMIIVLMLVSRIKDHSNIGKS